MVSWPAKRFLAGAQQAHCVPFNPHLFARLHAFCWVSPPSVLVSHPASRIRPAGRMALKSAQPTYMLTLLALMSLSLIFPLLRPTPRLCYFPTGWSSKVSRAAT